MKIETYTIEGSKDKEIGLLIAENEEWILVKHIPVDYFIDGYRLYKKKYILKRKSKNKHQRIARVLKLKNIQVEKPIAFEFGNVIKMLKWSEQTYGLFEFQDIDSDLFYGKINAFEDSNFNIDMIKASGKIIPDYEYEFTTEEIKVIGFESDYFESIHLLMNDELVKEKEHQPQLKIID